MVRRILFLSFVMLPLAVWSQEVLLPLQSRPVAPQSKSVTTVATIPFFDDFVGAMPAPQRWQPGGVTVEDGHGLQPPTVGVATLDALDASGHLYEQAVTSLFPADTLCSQPIRLDSLSATDSVVLSFYYLPGGGQGNLWERVGDGPDVTDSLFLDFYRATDSSWVTVWFREGVTVDSLVASTGRDWQYVEVAITDSVFFDSTFRFRFRNLCSLPVTAKPGLAGNCDYWHLDYVYLDRGRDTMSQPVFRDVAFVNAAPSMLSAYRAMPARHYRTTDMAGSLSMVITNLYNSDLATQYTYAVVDAQGDTLHVYDGGYENAPAFLPGGNYQTAQTHATPPVEYSFPELTGPTTYTVVHSVREGVAGDQRTCNDTVRYRQVFDNYYAYDDGTAENGYGLTSTASHLYLAYRFDLNVRDTLTALDLYFNRTANGDNELVPFRLMVWAENNGRPGSVLYTDEHLRHPEFEGLNRYHRYVLELPVVVTGRVFVGFVQDNNYYINLGFDRSLNTSNRIYYHTGTDWQQSILSGSLMMRPCFGASATVGIEEQRAERGAWSVYPNPASERLMVEGLPEGSLLTLYDMTGRLVFTTHSCQMGVSELANGVYILRCVAPEGSVSMRKVIIKH